MTPAIRRACHRGRPLRSSLAPLCWLHLTLLLQAPCDWAPCYWAPCDFAPPLAAPLGPHGQPTGSELAKARQADRGNASRSYAHGVTREDGAGRRGAWPVRRALCNRFGTCHLDRGTCRGRDRAFCRSYSACNAPCGRTGGTPTDSAHPSWRRPGALWRRALGGACAAAPPVRAFLRARPLCGPLGARALLTSPSLAGFW